MYVGHRARVFVRRTCGTRTQTHIRGTRGAHHRMATPTEHIVAAGSLHCLCALRMRVMRCSPLLRSFKVAKEYQTNIIDSNVGNMHKQRGISSMNTVKDSVRSLAIQRAATGRVYEFMAALHFVEAYPMRCMTLAERISGRTEQTCPVWN